MTSDLWTRRTCAGSGSGVEFEPQHRPLGGRRTTPRVGGADQVSAHTVRAMKHATPPLRRALALIVVLVAAGAASAFAAPAQPWQTVHASGLDVTSGTVFSAGGSQLQTNSDEMRAVQRDHGHHASDAKLAFRFLGNTTSTETLGSGLVRRQIGLKLQATNPCNLLYVMWRTYPDRVIEISIKSNPGETTSAECGNNGYSDVAVIPELAGGHGRHVLEADTRRTADGSLALAVYADGKLVRKVTLAADLTAGLDGPIGIRSDNGRYRFTLSAR
jgi:hypothetical protein